MQCRQVALRTNIPTKIHPLTIFLSCLRALFPTQSPAVYSSDAAFCSTFTASLDTRTTGYPSKATAACGTAAARYSSACSCKPTLTSTMSTSTMSTSTMSTSTMSTSTTVPGPTCTPSSNPNDGVTNGGFECGLSPWFAQDAFGTSHTISSPGDASNFAYEFIGSEFEVTNANPPSLSQSIKTVGGESYSLKFRTYFNKCAQRVVFVGVKINGRAVFTVDACDKPAGQYNSFQPQFFAFGRDTLTFEFIIQGTGAVIKIDNVSIVPVQ